MAGGRGAFLESSRSARSPGCRFRRTAGLYACAAAGRRSGGGSRAANEVDRCRRRGTAQVPGPQGQGQGSDAGSRHPTGRWPRTTDRLVPTAPSESLVTQVWAAVKRARLVIFIVLAVSQALLALVSWRIRVSRGRRGQGTEPEALEALGEKLGGIAGTLDD